MSMNILVETRVAPEITFARENPVLMAGVVAINKEGTCAKIGNGQDTWEGLTDVVTSRETIDKWLRIAESSTNSHLVTLPDVNFAYTVVTADSNAMIEQVVDTIIKNKDYFSITEVPRIDSDNQNELDGALVFNARGVQDLTFDTDGAERKTIISQLHLVNKDETEARTYNLYDRDAQGKINNIINNEIPSIKEDIEAAESSITNFSNEFLKINNKLVIFNSTRDGLVPKPTAEQARGNFFLNANHTWEEVQLYANTIMMSSTNSKTIAQAIQEAAQTGASSLTIGTVGNSTERHYVTTVRSTDDEAVRYTQKVYIQAPSAGADPVLYGAAYNDYAEARQTNGVSAGRVVVENGDDTLSISTERLMLGGNIVSDTYGMLIGGTDKAKTPIALCGRVLAYPFEDKEEYYPGAPVCTGPNGTVSLMSKDEVLHYPECIVGYVSAIPNYEEWNGKKVKGRIWIKVI